MFGASIVRQKRERERKERLAREEDPPIIPYIKPFGERFDPSQLPYFKYRQALAELEDQSSEEVRFFFKHQALILTTSASTSTLTIN